MAFLSEPLIDIVAVCDEPHGYYMRLWDAGEGVLLREIRFLYAQEEVPTVQVSGSGSAIAIGHGPGHLQVYHHGRGRLEKLHKQVGTYALTDFAFHRDGRMLAALAGEFAARHVYIIDMLTQVCCRDTRIAPAWRAEDRSGVLERGGCTCPYEHRCHEALRSGDMQQYDSSPTDLP